MVTRATTRIILTLMDTAIHTTEADCTSVAAGADMAVDTTAAVDMALVVAGTAATVDSVVAQSVAAVVVDSMAAVPRVAVAVTAN